MAFKNCLVCCLFCSIRKDDQCSLRGFSIVLSEFICQLNSFGHVYHVVEELNSLLLLLPLRGSDYKMVFTMLFSHLQGEGIIFSDSPISVTSMFSFQICEHTWRNILKSHFTGNQFLFIPLENPSALVVMLEL